MPAFAAWNSVPDPYYGCGCHPDIVERLWDRIGPALPKNGRCLIHGTPALAHPKSGVILALGIGTQYGLRLTTSLADEAIRAGAKKENIWSDGSRMNIQDTLGNDWFFGCWSSNESAWCRTVYDWMEHSP
ncbi:MAG: hypothetical protein SFY92_08675 [Verrucomicrobiae bacterium]|nr:hypothetical protein [Verrucomicrobiae bacterium]